MNKITFLGAALSVSILSGCMATGENSVNLADIDFNTLSCTQIETTFKDYKSNVDSADNMSSLVGMVSSEAASVSSTAKSTAMTAYYTAKKVAQPAIKAKGCKIYI
jgi:hypothetical protein